MTVFLQSMADYCHTLMSVKERVYYEKTSIFGGRVRGALLASALALAACSDDTARPRVEAEPRAQITTSAAAVTSAPGSEASSTTVPTQEADEPCSLLSRSPGKYFRAENSDNITEQLELLTELQAQESAISLADIAEASELMYSSFRDPMYADAMRQAKETIEQGGAIDTQSFLALPVMPPEMCDDLRITKDSADEHRRDFLDVSGYVVAESGRQLGRQAVGFARQAWERLEQGYNRLVEELEN